MIVPVMAISNLVLTQQIYSEETNVAHAHYREPVPLRLMVNEQERESRGTIFCLKQDEPLINYCKFLNTSVHCFKKHHIHRRFR